MSQQSSPLGPTERVARLFDELAPVYDQTGVAVFGPIADRLVELLEVGPGQRALDIGCGRGAVTFRLAEAVGAAGTVDAVDIAPGMVRLTGEAATRAGLGNVHTQVMDAADPQLPGRGYDVVASSLVLFFLPDPRAALTRWLQLVAPGGRIGVTTFGAQDDVWRRVDAVLASHVPSDMLDARTTGTQGPFASDEGMEDLFRACGATGVDTVREPLPVVFGDAVAWREWSLSVGQRAMWRLIPEQERDDAFTQAAALLEDARDGDGRIRLTQQVRYTLASPA